MPDTKAYHKALSVKSIIVGDRHRKDMGDLQALADSIKQHGLLQPIGVDPVNNLVFGERRLRACVDLLGWQIIPASIVDLDAIVLGEYAENEMRKDFTPMERAAIGKAVEAELGKRQGERTDRNKTLRVPGPTVEGRNRDIAAQRSGFGSGRTYERAKKVLDQGSEELQQAVDDGNIGIKEGAKIAETFADDKKKQGQVVNMERQRRKAEIAKAKQPMQSVELRPYDDETHRRINDVDPIKNQLWLCATGLEKLGKTPEQLAWVYVNRFPVNVGHMMRDHNKILEQVFAFVDAYRKLEKSNVYDSTT